MERPPVFPCVRVGGAGRQAGPCFAQATFNEAGGSMERIVPGDMGRRNARPRFTLVELIVVMGIMVMMLAVSFPALERMAIGNSVDAGARMVSSQLRLARQEALSNNKCIALLMPADKVGTGTNVPNIWYGAMRLCAVKYTSGQWVYDDKAFILDEGTDKTPGTADDKTSGFFPGSRWDFLPTGAVIPDLDDKNTFSGTPTNKNDTNLVVKIPEKELLGTGTSTTPQSCRAVIFRRNGVTAYDSGEFYIKVVQGVYDTVMSTGELKVTNKDNWLSIRLNPYTGKVTDMKRE